ncbi:hypothetical protein ACOXXX_03610 [Thalassococcus sp. BH17M4-6]|uniref:hypothetical protein n=1 Tax=Thalassococcus sp. BH17M4-6 TaxID=3413148 RepID=UPI003BE102A9
MSVNSARLKPFVYLLRRRFDPGAARQAGDQIKYKGQSMRILMCGALCALGFGLAGCEMPEDQLEPVVASFNEASVGIQLNGNAMDFSSSEQRAAAIARADAKANEICSRGPNRRAEFASTRNLPTGQYSYVKERLYLCLR